MSVRNFFKNLKRRKQIERSRSADGTALINLVMSEQLNQEQRKQVSNVVIDSMREGHIKFFEENKDRAYSDGLLVKEELESWFKNLGVDKENVGFLMFAHYNRKDHRPDEDMVVLTAPESSIHNNRNLFEERFGVTIMTAEEHTRKHMITDRDLMRDLKKDKPELYEELKKRYGDEVLEYCNV